MTVKVIPGLARAMDDGQRDTRSSKENGKDYEFEFNFPVICRFLNIAKNSVEHSQVVEILTF